MKREAYELAISGQYMIYEGSQYTSDLSCMLLEFITPVLTMCIFTNMRTKWARHDEDRQTHIQLITQYIRPHYVNMKIIHFPKHPVN